MSWSLCPGRRRTRPLPRWGRRAGTRRRGLLIFQRLRAGFPAGGAVTRSVRPDGRELLASDAVKGTARVDLYWLPLGAGGHFVRLNGRAYEALMARIERRPGCDLYHSALQVQVSEGTFVIEQTPVPDLSGEERGVVAGGAVGSRWAGRFRIFRYEIRVWRNGHIPDVAEAVDSPRRLTNEEDCSRRLLEVIRRVPTPVWGRDELGTGEMLELQLGDRVGYRAQRNRHAIDSAAVRRACARLAGRAHRRAKAGRSCA
jgi:hypothetical protein